MLPIVNFKEYDVVVGKSLGLFSSKCPVLLQQAIKQAHTYMSTNNGRNTLEKLFKFI